MEDSALEAEDVLIQRFSVGSNSLKKFQTLWLAYCCLFLHATNSLYRSIVQVNTNMLEVSVCFCNPLN